MIDPFISALHHIYRQPIAPMTTSCCQFDHSADLSGLHHDTHPADVTETPFAPSASRPLGRADMEPADTLSSAPDLARRALDHHHSEHDWQRRRDGQLRDEFAGMGHLAAAIDHLADTRWMTTKGGRPTENAASYEERIRTDSVTGGRDAE